MTTDSFTTLCSDCGTTANNMTCIKKYGARANKQAFSVSTFHTGVCDICGQTKAVTESRDFFYPDEQACIALKKYLERKS